MQIGTGKRPDDDSAYVCFRPREQPIAIARGTRRTNQATVDKLRGLHAELSAVKELMVMVQRRQQCKMELVEWQRRLFEERVQVRALKRILGEAGGDDDLLLDPPKRSKRADKRHAK